MYQNYSLLALVIVLLSILAACAASCWVWGLRCQESCPEWKRFQTKAGQKTPGTFSMQTSQIYSFFSREIKSAPILKKAYFNSVDKNK